MVPPCGALGATSVTWHGAAGDGGWLDSGVTYTVSDLVEKERFEARDEAGALAGLLTYQVTGPIIACTHTDVEPAFAGTGVEDVLCRAVMEDAKARNRTVVPMCQVLSAWLDKHREYEKIVARSTRRVK